MISKSFLEVFMAKYNWFFLLIIIVLFSISLTADTPALPDTPAGEVLKKFFTGLEQGGVEQFVNNFMSAEMLDRIPAERHIRFLTMLQNSHGGFTVYKIEKSSNHYIQVTALGKRSKAWRKIIVQTSADNPGKVVGMDISMTSAPAEYLARLPKMTIKRPKYDDSLVIGPLAEKIDTYMTGLEAVGYSGALGVIKDNKLILAKGYGYADREKKQVFNRKTVFTIGSIAKQFTGAAMVKLESMGKVSFQDTLDKFFKDVPKDKKNITIHQLLTHTAGFTGAIGDDLEKIERDDFIKQALGTQLKLKPGERYSYSNVGFSIAGAILEKGSGMTFEEFLVKYVLSPAGLKKTGYVLPKYNPEDIVVGYRGKKRWGKPTEKMWGSDGPGWHLKCNGGILSTIDEMLQWGQAILGNMVFTPEEKKNYLTPYVPEGPEGDSFYAYGWVRMKSSRGTDVITHNGGNPYIQNDMYIYPKEGVVMFITSNNGDYSSIDQSGKILGMIFGID